VKQNSNLERCRGYLARLENSNQIPGSNMENRLQKTKINNIKLLNYQNINKIEHCFLQGFYRNVYYAWRINL